MSTLLLHRDPKTIVPDLVDWFEEPFLTLRPYLGQPIKIEEYVEGDHYLIRAELAGIDPEKDVEIMVGSGYLTIRAERSDKIEGKHRSEFRYGSFSRVLSLPVNADEDAVAASYHDGILTISVGLKTEQKASAKKIEVTRTRSRSPRTSRILAPRGWPRPTGRGHCRSAWTVIIILRLAPSRTPALHRNARTTKCS